MYSNMSVKQAIRPRPTTRSSMSVTYQEYAEEKMNASFLSCSIEEEDILDNIEPNLVSAALTDSCSSHFSSDFRSYDDRFELSSTDPNNVNDTTLGDEIVSRLEQCLNEEQELNTYSNPVPAIPRRLASRTRPTCSPVDLFDEPICSHESRSKLSLSMHDISKIPSFPLVSKQSNFSSETIQSQSITTVGSCPKSKDSGFPRSLSCLSLNSGKSYDHIQSKVKDYIKQIKAGNKIKRKLTYESATNERTCCKIGDTTYGESTSPQILVPIINKLKDELEEKDRMLLKLQENYDTLLMKYAAAENRIDHLRVNSVGNSFNIPPPDYEKPKASPNMLLLPNLCDLQKESNGLETRDKYKPEPSNQPNVTVPRPRFTNLQSNCLVNTVKQLPAPFNSSTLIGKEKNGIYLVYQSHDTNCESEQTGNASCSIENVAHHKSTNDQQHILPNKENSQLPTKPLNHQLENPFAKVKRWQESLPSLHLIEPSVYDQFIGTDTGSEAFNQRYKTGLPQSVSNGIMLMSNGNELPVPTHLTLINSPIATATDFDALNNLCDDLSRHTSQPKGTRPNTKNVCQNSNSVSTSLDSSSTFLCLENASYQSTSGQEPVHCKDSSSIETSAPTHPTNQFSSTLAQNKPFISLSGQPHNDFQIKNKWAPSYLPPITTPLLHKNHLPTLPIIQPITKAAMPFVLDNIKDNGDSDSSLCRKRLLGQKARLLLLQYLKNSDSTFQISKETGDSFEAKNVSLVQCLDEMNQCAQKLRGKSEAIMEVLAKQLKES